MASEGDAVATESREPPRASLAKRLHSLSGAVPLAIFVVVHLWVLASLVGSRELYDRQIGWLHGGPLLSFLELGLVLVPLAYHSVYGVVRSLGPRDPSHAYSEDAMVTVQRGSGFVVLVFVALHVWELRAQTWLHGLPVASYSTELVEHLSSTYFGVPLVALGYLVGTAATIVHLVSGLTSSLLTWGFATTPSAERGLRVVLRVAGALLFALAAAMVIQLATGTRLFPAEEPAAALVCGPEAASPPPPPHAIPSASIPLPGAGATPPAAPSAAPSR